MLSTNSKLFASIAKEVGLSRGEEIKLFYTYSALKEELSRSDIIVGITNVKIFKYDKGSNSFTLRSDIKAVKHQRNGMFSWDKVEILTHSGKTETYGIYDGDTCSKFCRYLMDNPVVPIKAEVQPMPLVKEQSGGSEEAKLPAQQTITMSISAPLASSVSVVVSPVGMSQESKISAPVPDPILPQAIKEEKLCSRCGRDSHFIGRCYASTHLNGSVLPCLRCGRDSHSKKSCYAKKHIDGTILN
jgi:hypothetical protein